MLLASTVTAPEATQLHSIPHSVQNCDPVWSSSSPRNTSDPWCVESDSNTVESLSGCASVPTTDPTLRTGDQALGFLSWVSNLPVTTSTTSAAGALEACEVSRSAAVLCLWRSLRFRLPIVGGESALSFQRSFLRRPGGPPLLEQEPVELLSTVSITAHVSTTPFSFSLEYKLEKLWCFEPGVELLPPLLRETMDRELEVRLICMGH
uniref:AT05466p n=1 Tax=Drosophila melanogaster TaxID=7227 RepID=Q8T920_DROME|nr:AT05466p [Drosophila melanogaster]